MQDPEESDDARFKEYFRTVCNVIHSAMFVVQLLAGQFHARLQANSGLLWSLTIVTVILVQPLIIRGVVHQFKSEMQQVPPEDGISLLQTQIKELDLCDYPAAFRDCCCHSRRYWVSCDGRHMMVGTVAGHSIIRTRIFDRYSSMCLTLTGMQHPKNSLCQQAT